MEGHIHHVEHHKPVLTEAQLKKKDRKFWHILGSFLLDMLPVIFGILIAVGINSMKEKSHEKKLEKFYLKNIKSNLDTNIKGLEFDVKYFSLIKDAQKFFLRTQGKKEDSSIQKYYSSFFYVIQPQFNNTAFLTLQNTGKLDVISNLNIIEDLTSLYEVKIPVLQFFLTDYNQKYNSLFLPYLLNKDPATEVFEMSDKKARIFSSDELKGIISAFQLDAIVGSYKNIIELHKNLSQQIQKELDE
jgi:hypothetical protein